MSAPHFGSAYAMLMQLEHLRAQVALANRRKRAMFLLDADLRWIGGNEVAEWMVVQGWWKGRRGARLEAGHASGRARWMATLRELEQGRLPSCVLAVYDRNGQLVGFATMHVHSVAAGEGLPSYVLFVRPLQSGNDEDITQQLCQLFKLTPSEAALAIALRRHGELADAAASLKITQGTARTRLQAVFDKTAAHKQAELLRMLDALADAMA